MTPPRLSFVSVVYDAEYVLQELQARSMSRFVPESQVGTILLVDNSFGTMPPAVRTRLLSAYGTLAHLVRIVAAPDVARVPSSVGWRSQQALKLAVAEQLCGDYVVLDAKNHFVDTPPQDFFRSVDGRPRANAYSYEAHPLRPALEHVLGYLGVDPAPYIGCFTATVTPFVLDAETVRSVMRAVEARSGRPFAEEFVARDLTEFFLYAGWIVAEGGRLDEVFDLRPRANPIVWPKSVEADAVRAVIDRARQERSPVFSVHRRALMRMSPEAVDLLAEFWTERRLFATAQEARDQVATFRDDGLRAERRKRVRELPGRVRALPRAIRRRLKPRARPSPENWATGSGRP